MDDVTYRPMLPADAPAARAVHYVLGLGKARLHVVDNAGGRAWVLSEKGPRMLGAATEAAARTALWRALADAEPAEEVALSPLCAQHQWAIEIGLAARLKPVLQRPLFVGGWPYPPSLWLPSGIYF